MNCVGRAAGVFIVLAAASASICEAADYEVVYVKGPVNPAFQVCLDAKFKKIGGRPGEENTLPFFSQIYNFTYKTDIFNHVDRFWHAEIPYPDASPLIVTMATLRNTKGMISDRSGHPLASEAPMQAVSEVRGNNVFHGQVESRRLTDGDRANFQAIADCAK